MFDKLNEIDFDKLKNINFEFPKWKNEFNSYFSIMEKVLNLYLELKIYESLLSDGDKKVLISEINTFSSILLNIQNNNWKKPDGKKINLIKAT